ncbi:MAG: hypothetical protein AABM40_12365 [Chloroflexota bacterium]
MRPARPHPRGIVLAEGSANDLVVRAGTKDLESAFLALAEAKA